MVFVSTLWSVSFTAVPDIAGKLASALDENALAVTTIAPPRTGKARIEAIYSEKPDHTALMMRMAIVAAAHKCKPPALTIKELPAIDWVKKVSGDFPPLPIARWIVHGAHHRQAVPDRRKALQIDATSAFGTGEHPTTRGCLLMLDRIFKRKPPRSALDMGCGSGILAMAYAKAKHGHVVAVDLDPDSVRIAKQNARVNGLDKYIRTGWSRGYRARIVQRYAPYDLIMANIFAGPLSAMAKDLKRHLRPGGKALLSGLLSHQADKVLSAHRMQKIYLIKRLKIGEWSALVLKHPVKLR